MLSAVYADHKWDKSKFRAAHKQVIESQPRKHRKSDAVVVLVSHLEEFTGKKIKKQ